ncbi:DUF3649 domain-containing protein [Rhodocista pekingensis]|uniref:DUF3649 domain-containing protein n=1 Tax=Rhodocista pekingensis TaxID=201185 RepID=A0ABW2L1R0_9PROT
MTARTTTSTPAPGRRKPGFGGRSRREVLSRSVAGILAGYGLAAASAACVAVLLPGEKADAALTGTMLSFLVYTAAIIWAYAAASPRRAWAGILLPAALFLALFLLLR